MYSGDEYYSDYDLIPPDIINMEIEAERQAEEELQSRIPSEETWVDCKGDMIAIGDWVHVHWKLKRDDKWEDYFIEAKIIDILPADSDYDDEAGKPVYWPSDVVVEYIEDGVIVEEQLSCEYLPYENKNICHDISLKEF
jgi:hypothetical protein